MKMMGIEMNPKRRHLLQLLGGTSLVLGTMGFTGFNLPSTSERKYLYSAATLPTGVFALVQMELGTWVQRIFPLPFQGHDVLPLSNSEVLVFARRPGTQSAFVNIQTGETHVFSTSQGRHFNGHGCLGREGQVLFTTENAYEEVKGVIAIRDPKTGQHLGKYFSGGLDPHDIKLMPDGKTLVIANGGIETHPDFGRRKLNIATMQPSLVYLDSATGKVLDEYRLPQHQLSIRHLTVTPTGDVGVALQYEGNLERTPPIALVAWQKWGKALQPLLSTPAQLAPFKGYLGDIVFNPSTEELIATSLLGNAVGTWDLTTQAFKAVLPLAEPNGIVLTPDQQLLVSSATGLFTQCNNHQSTPCKLPQSLSWDNHLVLV